MSSMYDEECLKEPKSKKLPCGLIFFTSGVASGCVIILTGPENCLSRTRL